MEGTYEYELERAELLGVEPISREKWEEQNKARLEAAQEQEQSEIAQVLEGEDEQLKGAHGKMGELHNILSATQFKLNKFKVINLIVFVLKLLINVKPFRLCAEVLRVCWESEQEVQRQAKTAPQPLMAKLPAVAQSTTH